MCRRQPGIGKPPLLLYQRVLSADQAFSFNFFIPSLPLQPLAVSVRNAMENGERLLVLPCVVRSLGRTDESYVFFLPVPYATHTFVQKRS